MNKVKLALIAMVGILCFACGSKKEKLVTETVTEAVDIAAAATAELEKEAQKWRGLATEGNAGSYKAAEGEYFSFASEKKTVNYVDYIAWTATSKTEIGNCPAKSVWGMYLPQGEGDMYNEVPPNCEAITPKAVSGWKYPLED